GKLVLAHAGNIKPSDIHRQLLMSYDRIGHSRVESAERKLHDLNPHVELVPVPENVNEENAARLIESVDLVVDCAPLFAERFLMNRECLRQGKPMVECAMFDLEAQLTTILPGETPCLACLYPEKPPRWKRQFPVFGAVSGTVGCMGAMEAIKTLSGFGETLAGSLLSFDLRDMSFQKVKIAKRADCAVCSADQ
ncbi:MAG: HesA/MoeB/ThiF family protein, partial [Planctomycetota bacterium]